MSVWAGGVDKQQYHSVLSSRDLISALRYELPWFVSVFAGLLLLGSLLIYLLPNIYSVKSEIIIEPERAYTNSEGKETSNDMTQRAHAMLKSLMTSENIEKILIKFDQLPAGADIKERQTAIADFSENTRAEFDNVEVINQYTGREGMFSLGLSIEHDNTSPDLAYQITQELTDQLLNSTRLKTSKEDEQKLAFLKRQIIAAKSELEQTEETVASFKEKNAIYLPEVQPIAIRRMEDLESKLTETDQNLRSLRRSSDELLAELATKRQEVSVYSSDGVRVPGLEEKLLLKKNEYVGKLTNYTNRHPEVQALKQEIKDLQRAIRVGKSRTSNSKLLNDPVYSLLSSRSVKIQEEINHETALKEEIRKSLDGVNHQLERMPFVEQELQRLERDQEYVATKYKELETELVRMEINTGRRDANLLGQFQLLEQPQYPLSPSKPKKKILMIVLFLLAASAGYLAALVMHLLHDRINNVEDIEELTAEPHTYIIPDFNNHRGIKEKLFSFFGKESPTFKPPEAFRKKAHIQQHVQNNLALKSTKADHSQVKLFKQLEANGRYGRPE